MVLRHQAHRLSTARRPILTGGRFIRKHHRPFLLSRLLGSTLIFILAVASWGDSFGRYGYEANPGIDDLLVTKTGISAVFPGASHLDFETPIQTLEAESTHATAQVCVADKMKGSLAKVRSSLVGNSLDLLYQSGVSLTCRSQAPPFLSWAEGTVGPDVPTPDLKWALLSFSTAEPPFLLGFSGDKASLKITGSVGNWKIESPGFSGWVRVWLPFGVEPRFGTDAATLGVISKAVAEFSWLWETSTPTVSKVLIHADDLGVDATWKFDGPGAFVPQAPLLAQIGGNGLSIATPSKDLPGTGSMGPYTVVVGDDLTIHFPCRRVKYGRAVGAGTTSDELLASVSTHDAASVFELGCQCLLAQGDEKLMKLADDTVTRFLIETSYSLEPNTRQQLPFAADGDGLELAAAHSFLAQCAMDAAGSNQENALFESILWKRDWWTWMIDCKSDDQSRKATALSALAGAFSASSSDRLYGATLEAGLDAQIGERIWQKRKHLTVATGPVSEPLLGIREGIFVLHRPPAPGLDFFNLIQSPLKLGRGPSVYAEKGEGGYLLRWSSDEAKTIDWEIYLPSLVKVAPETNLKSAVAKMDKNLQILTLYPKNAGECILKLFEDPLIPTLPSEVPAPSY